jgi:transposase
LNATVTVKTTCEVEEENVVSRRTVSDWFQRLASGDNTLDDRPRSGRLSVIDPQELRVPLENQPYGTTRELLATLGLSTVIWIGVISRTNVLEKILTN